jgi:hypothetical protein
MDAADGLDPRQPKDQHGLRPKIEARQRLLKRFHHLSDFHSRRFRTGVVLSQRQPKPLGRSGLT